MKNLRFPAGLATELCAIKCLLFETMTCFMLPTRFSSGKLWSLNDERRGQANGRLGANILFPDHNSATVEIF